MSRPKSAREIELEQHIKTLRAALQDAPHSSTIAWPVYRNWYQQQRGPALESTDPDRWRAHS